MITAPKIAVLRHHFAAAMSVHVRETKDRVAKFLQFLYRRWKGKLARQQERLRREAAVVQMQATYRGWAVARHYEYVNDDVSHIA